MEFTYNAGGIKPSQISTLFQPSFKSTNGKGNGLSLMKLMIENMEGSIHVESIGEEARFCLSVPKVPAKNNGRLNPLKYN